MTQQSQGNVFKGGLDYDTDKRFVANNRITDGSDIEFLDLQVNNGLTIEPFRSTTLAYEVPGVIAVPQVDRLEWFGTGTYYFQIYNSAGTPLFGLPAIGTFSDNASLQTAIGAIIASYGYIAEWQPLSNGAYTLSVLGAGKYNLVYKYNSDKKRAVTIQDYIAADADLNPIAARNINDIQVVFSFAAGVSEIGIAKKVNGTYTYVRIVRSNEYDFNDVSVFNIRVEIQANGYIGIYWSDNTVKPKTLYVPEDYFTDCALKWTAATYDTENILGYYTLSSLNAASDLQLYNSTGRIEYSNQLQGGGNLISGGYRYAVRFGFKGTKNTTPWSYLSQLIPVFKTSIDSPSAFPQIQGDIAGEATSKINVLRVQGAQSEIFDFCDVAAVYYAGEVATASIIGSFFLTEDSFEISHTGNEIGVQTIDVQELIDVSEIILKSKSLEIKKNRLNLANNTVAISDKAFETILGANREGGVSMGFGKEELQTVGKLNSPTSTLFVAEKFNNDASFSPLSAQPFIFPNEITDTNNEYDNTTGAFTLSTPGVSQVTYDFSITFGSLPTVNTIQFSIFIDGIQGPTSPVFTGDTGQVFTSTICFGTNQFALTTGQTLVLKWTYGAGSNTTIRANSFLNISYTDSNTFVDFRDTRPGEYQLPENVATKTGYSYGELTPFFVCLHLDNGFVTQPYFCGTTSFSGSLEKNYLTDDNNLNDMVAYAYHGVLNNLPVAQLKAMGVIGVSVWRGIVNPTVLGSGVIVVADTAALGNYNAGYYAGIPNYNGEYGAIVSSSDPVRKVGFFISADTHAGLSRFSSGDQLVVFGTPTIESNAQVNNFLIGSVVANGSYAEYKGYRSVVNTDSINLNDSTSAGFNTIGSNSFISPPYRYSTQFGQFVKGGSNAQAIAFDASNFINAAGGSSPDNGVFMAQYRQFSGSLDLNNIKCVPTGTFIEFNEETPSTLSGVKVFGGDTYTQKTTVKLMYGSQDRADATKVRYSFINYYGQNRVNTQLFYTNKNQPVETWNLGAAGSINAYLFPPVVSDSNPEEQFNYDKGYDAENIINAQTPFNPNVIQNARFGARIWYSEQKPTGSVYDYYRIIKPASLKDMDAKNGNITALIDVNNVMICWQPNAVSVLPYQSDVALSDSEVFIGNGGVYAQRETIISNYGSTIQTGIHCGKSSGGVEHVIWYSSLYQKLMKYTSGTGVRSISDEKGIRSFLYNTSKFISNEWDIHMGFDAIRESFYISAKAYNKNIANWNPATSYSPGDLVNYQVLNKSQTFEYLPNIYRAIESSFNENPFDNPGAWEFIPTTDDRYYNVWTILYNERWDMFSTKSQIFPLRYFEYIGDVLCPRPKPDFGRVYTLKAGDDFLKYFEQDGDFKAGDFFVQVSVNKEGAEPKRYVSSSLLVGLTHQNNPTAVFENEIQNSAVAANQWELRRDFLAAAIRTDAQDRPLISSYMTITVRNALFMRLSGIITSYYTKDRKP